MTWITTTAWLQDNFEEIGDDQTTLIVQPLYEVISLKPSAPLKNLKLWHQTKIDSNSNDPNTRINIKMYRYRQRCR